MGGTMDEEPSARELPEYHEEAFMEEDSEKEQDDEELFGFLDLERVQSALTDPMYSFMVVMALSLGLTPLAADVRYMILWTLLLAMGGLVYWFGLDTHRLDATPANLAWGVGFGLLIGIPVLVLVAPALGLTSAQLFPQMTDMSVYMAMVFAMPLGETVFFRGALQETYGFRAAALTAGGWSLLLFVPHLTTLTESVVVGIAVFALSFAYAYVRQRNGLVAAWLCQVVASVLLLFVPRLG